MRIIFVRHGEPDYERDCLTETGQKQAEAAARRLAGEGITEIFSSPMGRSRETAGYAARLLGLPVRVLDYMHEITWGGPGIPECGHPWTLGERLINEENFDFTRSDWRKHPYFRDNAAVRCLDRISECFDAFLLDRGYRREGIRYFCEAESHDTVAVFSHGGSGACVLSHVLALPFPYVCTVLPYEFTSVITLDFPVCSGVFVHPRVSLFNDTAHTRGISSGLVFQEAAD